MTDTAVIVVSLVDVIVSQKRKTNIHCTGLYFDISRIYRSASSNTDILRRIGDCWKVTEIGLMKCRQPHSIYWTRLLTSLISAWKDSLQDRTKCKPSLQCNFFVEIRTVVLYSFMCISMSIGAPKGGLKWKQRPFLALFTSVEISVIILCVLYCYPSCWPCLSGESLHWPFSPGIALIWCLLFLLFQAVDWKIE